jgi:hypothetical protein
MTILKSICPLQRGFLDGEMMRNSLFVCYDAMLLAPSECTTNNSW